MVGISARILSAVAGVLLSSSPATANTFLHKSDSPSRHVSGAQLEKDFLIEIENVLGSDHRGTIERRLAPLEAMLRPTLGALPKNEQGRFGHLAVRHALHRLFVKRHGWYVEGLGASGDVSSSSENASAVSVFANSVPDHLQTLFEQRLGSHGLSNHEVALLAATLENLVHREAVERLIECYQIENLSTTAGLSAEEADRVLDSYMALHLTGADVNRAPEGMSQSEFLRRRIIKEFPGWQDVKAFLREVREDRFADHTTFSFNDVSDVVERVADRYGRWQNHDCRTLKRDLLAVEDDGTGRVSLSKFYGAALKGQWQFSESREYLRRLGALDEANYDNPRVIIVNYVLAPSNCVGTSSFYQQCCMNECEDLVEHLERELMEPEAAPERITEIIAGLPPSVSSNTKTIRPKLVERLNQIAVSSGGKVPLHGRLFAQWMHHTFPKECPFPHLAGSTAPVVLELYRAETGLSHVYNKAQMASFVDGVPTEVTSEGDDEKECSPWSDVEEHYVERTGRPAGSRGASIFRLIPVIAALVSMGRLVFRGFKSASGSGPSSADNFEKQAKMA